MGNVPCLKLIEDRFWNEIKKSEVCKDYKYPSFELYMFPQTWGSTALGFGGIGGQAITTAYTTVVIDKYTSICGVFFGERLAYIVTNPNQLFMEDCIQHNMASCHDYNRYIREL